MGLKLYSLPFSTSFTFVAVIFCLFASTEAFNGSGILIPVFTPTDSDGKITVGVIPKYAQFLKKNGASAVVVTSFTGEGPTVTLCQRKKLLDAWAKAARSEGLALMQQATALPMTDLRDLARYSDRVGVDAFVIVPPQYYMPRTPEELVDYMVELCEQTSNTTLIYSHVPWITGVNLDIYKFYKLATKRLPRFGGLICDLRTALLVQGEVKTGQRLYITDGLSHAPAALFGFDSFISSQSNLFPKLLSDICKSGSRGDIATTKKLHQRLYELTCALTSYGPLKTIAKIAMKMVTGIDVGYVREPIPSLNSTQVKALRADLIKLGAVPKD